MNEIMYRNEQKFIVSYQDAEVLRSRLRAILPMDEHFESLPYLVKTLYFDSYDDSALYDCLDGNAEKVKYRLRYYNNDTSFIKMEKKVKIGTRGYKVDARINKDEALALINGQTDIVRNRKEQIFYDYAVACKTQLLTAKVVMEYMREAYVFALANTRITIDSRMRSYIGHVDFAEQFFKKTHIPLDDDRSKFLVEVKYDGVLPSVVRALIQTGKTSCLSHSKYRIGRMMNRM